MLLSAEFACKASAKAKRGADANSKRSNSDARRSTVSASLSLAQEVIRGAPSFVTCIVDEKRVHGGDQKIRILIYNAFGDPATVGPADGLPVPLGGCDPPAASAACSASGLVGPFWGSPRGVVLLCDYQEASQMPQTSRCICERAYSDGTSLARQMPVVTARFTWHRVCRAWQAHHVAAGRKFLTTTRTPVSSAVVTGASSRNSIIVNQMGSSPKQTIASRCRTPWEILREPCRCVRHSSESQRGSSRYEACPRQ